MRNRYQRGLLAWLQTPGDPAGLPEMRAALRQLEQQAEGDYASFWRTAETFLRAISDGALAVGAESRRLCARIDLQMRAALAGALAPEEGLGDELRRSILQGAAKMAPTPELISLTTKPEAPPLDPEAVAEWGDAGQAAIAAWADRANSGLPPFRQALIRLCAAALALALPEALHLAESLAGVGDRLDDPAAAEDPHLRAAVSATLELLADTADLGLPVFAQRVGHVAARLHDCRRGPQPALSPTLLHLFADEVHEQIGSMREELACLHPEAEALVDAALAIADHAAHLELHAVRDLAEALAQACERVAAGASFDLPEVREVLDGTLAELEFMPELLLAGEALPATDEVLASLAGIGAANHSS